MTKKPKPQPHDAATFEKAAGIIAEICGIGRETITPESHTITDLGLDSMDFLDVAFAIDKHFGIKMPLELWTQEVTEGGVHSDTYFRMDGLCHHIEVLVEARG